MALPVLLRTVTELEATPVLPKSDASAFKERGGPLSTPEDQSQEKRSSWWRRFFGFEALLRAPIRYLGYPGHCGRAEAASSHTLPANLQYQRSLSPLPFSAWFFTKASTSPAI